MNLSKCIKWLLSWNEQVDIDKIKHLKMKSVSLKNQFINLKRTWIGTKFACMNRSWFLIILPVKGMILDKNCKNLQVKAKKKYQSNEQSLNKKLKIRQRNFNSIALRLNKFMMKKRTLWTKNWMFKRKNLKL